MASKWQRHDTADTYTKILTPDTPDAAMAIVRGLVKKFGLDVSKEDDSDHGARVSFSKTTYKQVAPCVGLGSFGMLEDIGTFEIHRCRIPLKLFKSIVMDMDIMLIQYGPPFDHETVETRSRFFSPVFNHLVKQFTFMLRNHPEIIAGDIATQDRIGYFFKIFGAVAVLLIEMKRLVGSSEERLKGIAQVIAKSDGCALNNHTHGFSLPIYCIFSDGWSFEFFKGSETLRRGLQLSDNRTMETPLPWILQLRCVCETIFDVMLSGYIAGLKACYNQLKHKGKEDSKSFDEWDRALRLAERAQATFREAEVLCEDGNIVSADVIADEALLALQESTGAVPTIYESELFMTGWDDAEVNRASLHCFWC
ncbi:uncharacterized protein EI90DRAFT_3061538 [Cantharellus anzutake]|uniref:uncharacterized protein n=1 Tax=Cantharellus anzutake TaxID=1750568 RepID=UPI001904D83E|nr:uncharacterized protein EI90DRAFT_3061538 [Cantharellus anzutake]KAF8329679.1 hypothetical protein EI90DRAFT_3061538 [Cantharellus anzutake]